MTNKATRDARVADTQVAEIMGGKWIIFKNRDYLDPDNFGKKPNAFMVEDIQYREYRNLLETIDGFIGGEHPDHEFANDDDPRVYGRNWSLPFISAPTYETDGIVKEWAMDNFKHNDFLEFVEAVVAIIQKRDSLLANTPASHWLHLHVQHGIPGDYAMALLAVKEERGE